VNQEGLKVKETNKVGIKVKSMNNKERCDCWKGDANL
jgi:hypothetical protein